MKIVVFTLGCKVNECESGSLVTALEERGHTVCTHLEEAELYVLNTCAVTAEAEAKSRQAIARIRKLNAQAKILVCGCASEKSPADFAARENVVFVTGARQKLRILDAVQALEREESVPDIPCGNDRLYEELPDSQTGRTRAFIKIQDGCNRFCSYCIIPYLRGRTRSRKFSDCVREVENCHAEEAVLTGIDVSTYRDGDKTLADLLLALKDSPVRIRLGSLEVSCVTQELLSAAKAMQHFAPHFHLSLQSGSNAVLKKMNRHYTREEYIEKCREIYEAFPNAAITTDIIVGFPTETEEDFADSVRIVREVGFAQVHCFPFSPREGTVAYKMPDLPASVKKERMARLIAVKNAVQTEYEERFVGKEVEFVPETYADGKTYGYTENYIRLAVPEKIEKRTTFPLRREMIVR